MKIAIYPGSFDPLTNGHLDIIKRASKLFDEIHVLVSYNITKKSLFTPNERVDMINECVNDIPNIIVKAYDGLIVNYCKENNTNILIRGIRNFKDYEDEFSLNFYNKEIYPEIETVILLPSVENQFISSSGIKELVTFNCDISKYVPMAVKNKIIDKMIKS